MTQRAARETVPPVFMTEQQALDMLAHLAAIEESNDFVMTWLVVNVMAVCVVGGLVCWRIILEAMRSRTPTG